MDRSLLVSSVESQLCECPFMVLPHQLVGSGVYSPASPICSTSSVLRQSSFGISASVFASSLRVKSSRWGHPSGSSLSQSSIGTKTLPPPSWCLVGVFAMGSPCRVNFVSDLDRNEDSLRAFPSGWRQAFTMGSPVSGRVALFCALNRNEGFFRSSILRCFAMGSPCGSSCVFSHSIVTKSTLDSWSVFLQDGVPPLGSGSDDLISNEGITTVGLLGAVFSGQSSGCPWIILWSAGLLCSGWVPYSVVFASGDWFASAASRWCFSPGHFHALVFHAWGAC